MHVKSETMFFSFVLCLLWKILKINDNVKILLEFKTAVFYVNVLN